jgi:NO-binding membrane sensor protein with MHYT domain
MVVTHEPWIVALSVLVAVQGAFVGLKIMLGLPDAAGGHRRLLLAGAAVTLAVAIWSMHFVGMLAVRSSVRIDFLLLPTIVSFLVCVLVVGLAAYLAATAPPSKALLVVAAVVMGAGIVTMHFTGMMALHSNAMMHHNPAYVVASFLIGVIASGLALHFVLFGSMRLPLATASIALGLAISGMHYTAMAGMTLDPVCTSGAATDAKGMCTIELLGTALSRDLLAVIVAVVAFAISSAFLLALVPDGTPAKLSARLSVVGGGMAAAVPQGSAAAFVDAAMLDAFTETTTPRAPDPAPITVLPVQKGGATHYLPVERVHAVKAEAHYTTVFDGNERYFCSLSIGDVEGRLAHYRFARVHRSHIVAIEHIRSLRKTGDGGIAELDSITPYHLPVSRKRLSELRAMLKARC